jgi:[citrate (pro-3S)-lyase] ligase
VTEGSVRKMIRFCDKEVYTVYKEELNRGKLISFFLGGHTNDIVAVYQQDGSFYGIIGYLDILENQDVESAIHTEKLTMDESVFKKARKIFDAREKQGKNELIPVFNRNGELDCFAYDCTCSYLEIFEALHVLESMPVNPQLLQEYDKELKIVCIFDMNELAYLLYKVMRKHNIPVWLFGERWKILDNKVMENIDDYPDYSRLYIYAEGNGSVSNIRKANFYDYSTSVAASFLTVIDIAKKIGSKVLEDILFHFNEKCSVFLCDFPEYGDGMGNEHQLKIRSVFWDVINKIVSGRKLTSYEKNIFDVVLGKEAMDYFVENKLTCEMTEESVVWKSGSLSGTKLGDESKIIYLIGPCIVRGGLCRKEDTFAINQQRKIELQGYSIIKIFATEEQWYIFNELQNLPVREKDIIVFCGRHFMFEKIPDISGIQKIELTQFFKNQSDEEWLFLDIPIHTTPLGNQKLSQYIYDNYLQVEIKKKNSLPTNHYVQKGELFDEDERQKIYSYVDTIPHREGENGAIVMNCNPFTLGHQWLVEQAAKKVDYLYVFVVQEEKSYFPFEDRIRMVKSGTKHLDNVIVVPSGEFVLSYKTLPSYFTKEEQKDVTIDASHDIEIFARYVAPELNIIKRFVGEEPIDKITKQYNEQMADILPEFGIEFVEFPRRRVDEQVISASSVRALLKEEQWEEIKKIVPKTTYDCLV